MRKLRDNMLRIVTALDMFISAGLLLAYIFTGLVGLMVGYYVLNLIFMTIIFIHFFELIGRRDRIEKSRRHIHKKEEGDT